MTLCLHEDIIYTRFLTIHNVTTTIIKSQHIDYGVTFDNINESALNNLHCYSRYYKHRCANDTIARYMNLNCCL